MGRNRGSQSAAILAAIFRFCTCIYMKPLLSREDVYPTVIFRLAFHPFCLHRNAVYCVYGRPYPRPMTVRPVSRWPPPSPPCEYGNFIVCNPFSLPYLAGGSSRRSKSPKVAGISRGQRTHFSASRISLFQSLGSPGFVVPPALSEKLCSLKRESRQILFQQRGSHPRENSHGYTNT